MARTRKRSRKGSQEAQAQTPGIGNGNEERPMVEPSEVRVESASESEAVGGSGERFHRLSPLPSGPSEGELEAPEQDGREPGISGDSEQLRHEEPADQPPPVEERPDAERKDDAPLLSLADPAIADLHPVVVAFLQLSQHQFALHLQRQGVFTMPDGSLAISRELVHRLRTDGVAGMAFSAQPDPLADIEQRIEAIATKVAVSLRPQESAPVMSPESTATVPAPARPQAGPPGSRYPLGRMLADSGR